MRGISRQRKAASAVEYGLLAGLIAVFAIGGVYQLGRQVDFQFRVVAREMSLILGGDNLLVNGDFDTVAGLPERDYGYESPTLAGWESADSGHGFELHASGYDGMQSVNGGYWLDMGESPGNMVISQNVEGLVADAVYKITFFAGDRASDLSNQVNVFWNGSKIGVIDPQVEDVMDKYEFNIRGGSGNGQNIVRLEEVGPDDSVGISLDKVRVWGG